jgi:hypothetical protein
MGAGRATEIVEEIVRPVLRLPIAVPPGVDVGTVIAGSVASWARALDGRTSYLGKAVERCDEDLATHVVGLRLILRLRLGIPPQDDGLDELVRREVVTGATRSWVVAVEGSEADECDQWVGDVWYTALPYDAWVYSVDVLMCRYSVQPASENPPPSRASTCCGWRTQGRGAG